MSVAASWLTVAGVLVAVVAYAACIEILLRRR